MTREPMDHEEAMRKLSDLLARMRERKDTIAIGVALVYADGFVGTFYESEDHLALVGALEYLKCRIMADMEDDEEA